jgi:hypothetical protein
MLGDTGVAVHPEDARYTELVGKKVRLPLVGRLIPIVADDYADPEMGSGASTASMWIYADGVDQAWKRAIDAGGKQIMPLMDQFWGDRMGTLTDPFGNRWTVAQHMKNLTDAEIKQAGDAFIASMKK